MNALRKYCRSCGELLTEKNGNRFCRNGCNIYTAMPQGSLYYDQSVLPATGKSGNHVTGGGTNNLRKIPRFEE